MVCSTRVVCVRCAPTVVFCVPKSCGVAGGGGVAGVAGIDCAY